MIRPPSAALAPPPSPAAYRPPGPGGNRRPTPPPPLTAPAAPGPAVSESPPDSVFPRAVCRHCFHLPGPFVVAGFLHRLSLFSPGCLPGPSSRPGGMPFCLFPPRSPPPPRWETLFPLPFSPSPEPPSASPSSSFCPPRRISPRRPSRPPGISPSPRHGGGRVQKTPSPLPPLSARGGPPGDPLSPGARWGGLSPGPFPPLSAADPFGAASPPSFLTSAWACVIKFLRAFLY